MADEDEAKTLIPEGAVVFLATGRQSLPAWEGLRAASVHLRVIDPPDGPFPFPGGFVVARPPFDTLAEVETFSRLGVTHLVVKDSGAADGRAKLDAQLADESRELLAAALETEEGQQRLAEILERQEAESVAVTTPEAGDDLEGSGSEN